MFRLGDPYRFSLVTGRGATPKIDFLLEKASKNIGKDQWFHLLFLPCQELHVPTPLSVRWAKGRMVQAKKMCCSIEVWLFLFLLNWFIDLDVDAILMLGGFRATVIMSWLSWLFHDLNWFGFTVCNCFFLKPLPQGITMLHLITKFNDFPCFHHHETFLKVWQEDPKSKNSSVANRISRYSFLSASDKRQAPHTVDQQRTIIGTSVCRAYLYLQSKHVLNHTIAYGEAIVEAIRRQDRNEQTP